LANSRWTRKPYGGVVISNYRNPNLPGKEKNPYKAALNFLHETFGRKKPPKITMDVEVICSNEDGLKTVYSPNHFCFDMARLTWIPDITSEKPYWQEQRFQELSQ
jgi:hypothetical protein